MNMTIDRHSATPIYIQISDQIRRGIFDGSLVDGYLLPSERKLAADLGVHRNTVTRAYLDLKGDDKVPLLISSKLGYTVNSRAVSLRQQAFCVNASIGDTHPNLKGHEYRSTIIENFLRSL